MKIFITILMAFCLAFSVSGQGINELEKKKGFKDFVLGESITVYKSRLSITDADVEKNKDKTIKEYSLLETVKIKEQEFYVSLRFYKDRIYGIDVFRVTNSKTDFDNIKSSLFSLYGAVDNERANPKLPPALKDCGEVFIWNSQSVGLELAFCSSTEPYVISLSYWDLKGSIEILKDEF